MLQNAPSLEDAFKLYSVFGGTPYYLNLLDPQEGVSGNIRRLVLSPGAPLLEAVARILGILWCWR